VWLPSGGSLVIDRTEAMTVVDVNTGKFVGSGGNLEQTVTRNNMEAAEEIVRQLRLRDIGGIIVIDFIDMVLESNRDLVLRRLTECLGRDRTKHQVAEVTSLGLVQMTRKRVGQGLLEVFSEPCEHCRGRGILVHTDPVDEKRRSGGGGGTGGAGAPGGSGGGSGNGSGGNRRERSGSSREAKDASKDVDEAALAEETGVQAGPAPDGEQPEGTRTGGRRNRGRRGRGQSGEDRAAEDAAALAAAEIDADPTIDTDEPTEPVEAEATATPEVDAVEEAPVEEVPVEQAPVEQAPVAEEVGEAAEVTTAEGASAEVVEGPEVPAVVEVVPDGAPEAPAAARPRRRRAASRPAGPPVS
jgi:ribonuclease E